jgi:hypothetical protein
MWNFQLEKNNRMYGSVGAGCNDSGKGSVSRGLSDSLTSYVTGYDRSVKANVHEPDDGCESSDYSFSKPRVELL